MFRALRRFKQALPQEECLSLLERGESGVLALLGDDDYPYAVPLSYTYMENKLYFHGAKKGHKMDAMMHHHKASFCVVTEETLLPESFTTSYKSVIVFGTMRLVSEEAEMRHVMRTLCKKYAPMESQEHVEEATNANLFPLQIFVLDIDHISGKESLDKMRERV